MKKHRYYFRKWQSEWREITADQYASRMSDLNNAPNLNEGVALLMVEAPE